MFTGLVAGTAKMLKILSSGSGVDKRFLFELSFSAAFALKKGDNIKNGDSVAINGACLTVESVAKAGELYTIMLFASAETLASTNLGRLKIGNKANAELALAFGERLGGHIVSGHVDGLAKVVNVRVVGQSKVIEFSCEPAFYSQIIAKGSVCLDGVSLTVLGCENGLFSVNIIPKTQEETMLLNWQPGYEANLETDVIGKYVLNGLAKYLEDKSQSGSGQVKNAALNVEFFAKNGFI